MSGIGAAPEGDYDQMTLGSKLQELAWRLDRWLASSESPDAPEPVAIFEALEALATEIGEWERKYGRTFDLL
jgi:hypothetical protein